MKVDPRVILIPLALGAAGTARLQAGDPGPSFDLKIHGGGVLGDIQKSHQDNLIFGIGVASRIPAGPTGAFLLEVGFDYIPGRDHDETRTSGPIYYNYQNPVTSYQGHPLYLSVLDSVDLRKVSAQGLSLRVGYTDRLAILEDGYWFAGTSLDFYKSEGQFSGTLYPRYTDSNGNSIVVPGYEPVDPSNPDGPKKDYYEGWAYATDKTKATIGLFGGVGVPISENLKFEFTVRNIGLTHLAPRPFTYTGQPAGLDQSTKRGFTFEVGLALQI